MGCENSAPESSSPTSPPRRPRRLRRRPSDASPRVNRMILGNEGESEDRERVSPVQGHNDHGNPFFLESTNAPDDLSTTMEPRPNAPIVTSSQLSLSSGNSINSSGSGVSPETVHEFDGIFYPVPAHRASSSSIFSSPSLAQADSNLDDEEQNQRKMSSGSSSSRPQSGNLN